jgi:hypothetical protein
MKLGFDDFHCAHKRFPGSVSQVVRYKPGSFSKNFAWHGNGLSRLHSAIRSGFNGEPVQIEVNEFRRRCDIRDPDIQLIPIKFFLFSKAVGEQRNLQLDELVYQAIEHPHSSVFDRLAVFALHLSNVGEIKSGGTPWLRDFVIQHLWVDGFWSIAALEKSQLDSAFARSLNAKKEVRVKCRTNYRHIMDLAGFIPKAGEFLDNREGPWLSAAMILNWDREILSGSLPNADSATLIEQVRLSQVHKLLGVPETFAVEYAKNLAPTYLESGDIRRFSGGERSSRRTVANLIIDQKKNAARRLEEIAGQINMAEVARVKRFIQQQVRNVGLSASLKALYDSQCMFCEHRICVSMSPDKYYTEAAHIIPIGQPHNGPDRPENMLVLCPNCHVEFDFKMLTISFLSDSEFIIRSKQPDHPLDGKTVKTRMGHNLGKEFCVWHESNWSSTGK